MKDRKACNEKNEKKKEKMCEMKWGRENYP